MHGALGMRVLVAKGRRVGLFPVRERGRGLLIHMGFRATVIQARDKLGLPVRQDGWYAPTASNRTYEEGLPLETGILGFRENAVPVSCGKEANTVYSSTP